VTDAELGPIDLALQAAAPRARHASLARDARGRVTAADVYLEPARRRSNVTVRPNAAVATLMWRGDRITGVALASGEVLEADAVVMCAGAIATPLLLLQSGISAGIGDGLMDHPSATINVRLHHPQPDPSALVTTGVVAGDDRVQVTAMSHVGVAPGEQALGAVTVALLRPRSRGSVSVSADGSVRVEMRQYSNPDDLDEMVAAVEVLEERVSQLGDVVDEATIDDHGTPVATLVSRDAIVAWLQSCAGTYVHASASCPLGSVLDADGRVAGVRNLFVVDASAFPEIPAAPTYLPVLMLAERLAARLRLVTW
jgi:choline dehydrogenase-like flavoprotein